MPRITMHSKQRSVERIDGVNNFCTAKRVAKQAKVSGKTINRFQQYPKFFAYLKKKKNQTHSCSIRVYKDNIFIWKNKTLVTVHPIPDRFLEDLK